MDGRGQCDFRHKDQRAPAGFEAAFNQANINFSLAAGGNSVEQNGAELVRVEALGQIIQRPLL